MKMAICKDRILQINMKIFFVIFLCCLTQSFHIVRSTEVTVASSIIDNSLGIEIELPVLMCHARHTGYTKVMWYKDFELLKNGSSDESSHILSLASLFNSSMLSEEFDNILKLQGYYWCVTDHTEMSNVFDYLFRIEEVHTFVGSFMAKPDYTKLDRDMQEWKKKIYEEEMETTLFGFLQYPSVYVTEIKELPEGEQVRFFVYVRPSIHPRKPVDEKLILDQDHLEYILEHLKNESSTVDVIFALTVRDWTDLMGIDIDKIDLRSTLGCYEESVPLSPNVKETVEWPYARIGDVVIPDNACSSKNGISVTRVCTGSFYIGAKWGNPSGNCEKQAKGITLKLKKLYDKIGQISREQIINELATITEQTKDLKITDLHITIEILKEFSVKSKLNSVETDGILTVIDNIIHRNITELIAAKNIIYLTSRILRIFDNLLEKATEENKEIRIAKHHLMLDTKYTQTENEKDHILGLAVIAPNLPQTLYNGSIEFVTNKTLLPRHESLAYFALPRELVLKRESEMNHSNLPCQVNMIFFKEWYLFQNPKAVLIKRNYKVLPTPVIYVSISGGPAWNLTDPVHLYFKDTLDEEVEDPVCVYYDPRLEEGKGAWSSEGCEYEGYKNGYYHCQCHHLSIFAVILSQNPDLGSLKELKLGTSVYVACGVSILALSLAVILFVLSKIWRQTIDHSILFALSLCFLVCIIIIFVSETHFARRPGCVVLALVLHYTIFTIFGWILIQAIIYRLRFTKRTDVGEIPYFMIKTGLAVWGVPIIIVVIMWFSSGGSPFLEKDNCWPTVSEVSKDAVIPLGVLIIIILCVYGCATYALTCRFKKDFLIGDLSSYNDIVIKYRVAFTIFLFFVFTWLFGFLALHMRTQPLRILFSICMTLTAYYLALFFIFQEVSLWDLCRKCKQNAVEPEDTPPVQMNAKSYQSVDDSNKTEKPAS